MRALMDFSDVGRGSGIRSIVIALFALAELRLSGVAPRNVTRDDILRRVGSYVQQTETRLAVVIGDEQYQQDVWERKRHIISRSIRSEVLFMSLAQENVWLSARNVLSVDGRLIPDSKGRLERILNAPGFDYVAQLRLLKAESARFDVGQLWRTTGSPTLVFRFFLPENQSRFTFGQPRFEQLDHTEVVKLTFDEHENPTAIEFNGGNIASHGEVWVRPEDGAFVRTHLRLSTPTLVDVSVTTKFQRDSRLDEWVPQRMVENYSDARDLTICVATYSNFRRFETSGRLITQ
jgi:hypothetical protein